MQAFEWDILGDRSIGSLTIARSPQLQGGYPRYDQDNPKIPKKRGCIAKGEGSHKECARRTDACPHGVGGADGDRALGQPEQSSTDEHAEDRYDEPDPSVFWAVCDF